MLLECITLLVRNAHSGPLRNKQKVPLLSGIPCSSFNTSFRKEGKRVCNVSVDTNKELLLNGETEHKANCGMDLSSKYIWKSIWIFFAMVRLAYGSVWCLRYGSCISCSTLFLMNFHMRSKRYMISLKKKTKTTQTNPFFGQLSF